MIYKHVNFIKSDAYNLPFREGVFDCVISADVLEHLKYLELVLCEIERTSKRSVNYIISVPTENVIYKFLRVIITFTSMKLISCLYRLPTKVNPVFIYNFIGYLY